MKTNVAKIPTKIKLQAYNLAGVYVALYILWQSVLQVLNPENYNKTNTWIFFLDLFYWLPLSTSRDPQREKKSWEKNGKSRTRKDTEGLCNNKYSYKSQLIIIAMANYEET